MVQNDGKVVELFFLMAMLLLALLPVLSVCWWDVGHMLTAAIAESKLLQEDPYAAVHFRELIYSINELCDGRSSTFIESACWPDDIKSTKYGMGLFNPWHYKDG